MFKVIFYKTETGREPAKEFIDSVRFRKGKDAEINIEKLEKALREYEDFKRRNS